MFKRSNLCKNLVNKFDMLPEGEFTKLLPLTLSLFKFCNPILENACSHKYKDPLQSQSTVLAQIDEYKSPLAGPTEQTAA